MDRNPKVDKTVGNLAYETNGDFISEHQSSLHVLRNNPSESSLWREAWEEIKAKTGWEPPAELRLGDLNLQDEVQYVREAAQVRATEAGKKERLIPVRASPRRISRSVTLIPAPFAGNSLYLSPCV